MQTQAKSHAEETTRHTATEIAIVRVRDEESGKQAQDTALDAIASWPGFIQARKLQALNDPTVIADIVLWESLDLANVAGERFKTDAAVEKYKQAVSEMIFLDHAIQLGEEQNWLSQPGDGVLEVAISTAKNPEPHRALQEKVHTHLENQPPCKRSWRLQGKEKPSLFVDLINWTNQNAAEETAKSVMANPAYSPFFDGIENMHYFGFFTVRGIVEGKQ